jgi:hypothetical protein
MAFSLFFTYANTNKDKAHFDSLSKYINPFVVKSKSGKLLDCENEDLLEIHAENAHVIVVLLSSDYLEYDNHPKRKRLHNKISTFISDPSKFIITVETEDCLWQCDETLNGLKPHKLQKTGGSDFDYMPIVRKIMDEINDRKPKVHLKEMLHKGLYNLNFDEQRLVFNAHFKELSLLNILVTRGTQDCGQHLLLKTFLRLQKINFENEQRLVWLSAKNFAFDQSEDWIWQQIGEKFGLFPRNIGLQDIGNYVIQRLQSEPILIRFDDIHWVKKESIEVIKTIWEQLYYYINSRGITFKHQIFVFVTDRSGDDVDYSKHEFSSIEYAPICDKILCILPKIKFLNKTDMANWLNILSRDPELQIISQHLETSHVLPDDVDDISIAKAVGKMIDKLGELDEDLKNSKDHFLARI